MKFHFMNLICGKRFTKMQYSIFMSKYLANAAFQICLWALIDGSFFFIKMKNDKLPYYISEIYCTISNSTSNVQSVD